MEGVGEGYYEMSYKTGPDNLFGNALSTANAFMETVSSGNLDFVCAT